MHVLLSALTFRRYNRVRFRHFTPVFNDEFTLLTLLYLNTPISVLAQLLPWFQATTKPLTAYWFFSVTFLPALVNRYAPPGSPPTDAWRIPAFSARPVTSYACAGLFHAYSRLFAHDLPWVPALHFTVSSTSYSLDHSFIIIIHSGSLHPAQSVISIHLN